MTEVIHMNPEPPAPPPGSAAVLSDCRRYRYTLTRRWVGGPAVNFLMLNPSTADASQDDPTIRRCIGFASAWGFGGLVVTNLFALRATDPRELYKHADPVSRGNDPHILATAVEAGLVVCAWGVHGFHRGRDKEVLRLLAAVSTPVVCLGLTKGGYPKHPLYLPAASERVTFGGAA